MVKKNECCKTYCESHDKNGRVMVKKESHETNCESHDKRWESHGKRSESHETVSQESGQKMGES